MKIRVWVTSLLFQMYENMYVWVAVKSMQEILFGMHCEATRMLCAPVVLCFEVNRKNGKLSSVNQAIFEIQHVQGL